MGKLTPILKFPGDQVRNSSIRAILLLRYSILVKGREAQTCNFTGRLEDVLESGIARLKTSGNIPAGERFYKLVANCGLDVGGRVAILEFEFTNFRGKGDALGGSADGSGVVRQNILHAIRIEPPFRDEAVSGNARMHGRLRDAITIRNEPPGNRAQPYQIEARVFGLQGIEGPFDEADAVLERVVALKEFQAAAYSTVLIFGKDGGHMRMEKRLGVASAYQ